MIKSNSIKIFANEGEETILINKAPYGDWNKILVSVFTGEEYDILADTPFWAENVNNNKYHQQMYDEARAKSADRILDFDDGVVEEKDWVENG